jgi:hypothetical protein
VLGHDQFSAALSVPGRVPARWKQTTPLNTAVMFVPQQEAWVVERMGKFHRVLDPGNDELNNQSYVSPWNVPALIK